MLRNQQATTVYFVTPALQLMAFCSAQRWRMAITPAVTFHHLFISPTWCQALIFLWNCIHEDWYHWRSTHCSCFVNYWGAVLIQPLVLTVAAWDQRLHGDSVETHQPQRGQSDLFDFYTECSLCCAADKNKGWLNFPPFSSWIFFNFIYYCFLMFHSLNDELIIW